MDTEQLRVGDAERDEVTTALHEHFAQGRLTRDELDERLTATLSARTVGDLRNVTADLPGTPAALSPGPPATAYWGRGPYAAAWPRGGWGPRRGRPFGPLLLVAVVVTALTGGWFILPLLACVWFTVALTGLRHTRRRRLSLTTRR
ncbi:MAG TPA: DUF1707 domain-containing protein [Actinoallomurus sp.]|jgi:hypothetical protein